MVLSHALEQLDTKHKLGVIPLVCSTWRSFAFSNCSTSLEVTLSSKASADSWLRWMRRRGKTLQTLRSLRIAPSAVLNIFANKHLVRCCQRALLLKSMQLLCQLTLGNLTIEPELTHLTSLTSLTFNRCQLQGFDTDDFTHLRQLQSLDLSYTWGVEWRDVWEACRRLPQITSLILGKDSYISAEERIEGFAVPRWLLDRPVASLKRFDWVPGPTIRITAWYGDSSQLARLPPLARVAIIIRNPQQLNDVVGYLDSSRAAQLEELELTGARDQELSMDAATVTVMISALLSQEAPKLRRLHLENINVVPYLEVLVAALPKLEKLTLWPDSARLQARLFSESE